MKEGNYVDALKNLALVNSEDMENYSNAQEQIREVSDIYCNQAIEEATEALTKKDALSALTYLDSVDEAYRNKELIALIDTTVIEAQTQVIEEINRLLAAGNYKDAYIYIQKLPENVINGQIESLKSEVVSSLLQTLKGFFSVSYDSIDHSYSIDSPSIQGNISPVISINENYGFVFFSRFLFYK